VDVVVPAGVLLTEVDVSDVPPVATVVDVVVFVVSAVEIALGGVGDCKLLAIVSTLLCEPVDVPISLSGTCCCFTELGVESLGVDDVAVDSIPLPLVPLEICELPTELSFLPTTTIKCDSSILSFEKVVESSRTFPLNINFNVEG
jgi:hypothetical protein